MLLIGIELFGLSTMTLAMLISTFFKDRQVIFTVGIWILLVPLSLYLYCVAIPHSEYGSSFFTPAYYVGFLLPNFSFGVILIDFYITGSAMTIFGLDVNTCYVALALTIPLYFTLYVYFDNILPNSGQVAKNWLYCCKKSQTKKVNVENMGNL
jgi:hypothetical protein